MQRHKAIRGTSGSEIGIEDHYIFLSMQKIEFLTRCLLYNIMNMVAQVFKSTSLSYK